MSVNYELLSETEGMHLRRQRLLDLEADHFRFVLDLEELPEGVSADPIMAKIADIERRIALHRRALNMPEAVIAPDVQTSVPEKPEAG